MPYVSLQSSPLVPGVDSVQIFYREVGDGAPLLFLHGGWGYEMYPFQRQIEGMYDGHRIIIPDRGGYGKSTRRLDKIPAEFHYHAASETLSFLDELKLDRIALWGHSDGAVVAAIIGFTAPERVNALIFEAFHFQRSKLSSQEFFKTAAYTPEDLSPDLCERFAREHGADYWRQLITDQAKAWLEIGSVSEEEADDLYRGRLSEINAATLVIHGALDPRTEPGELDLVQKQLAHCELKVLAGAAHSPHSEAGAAESVTELAREFLARLSN